MLSLCLLETLITAIDKHELIYYHYVKHSPDHMQTYDELKMELANRETSCNPFIVYVYHFCWATQVLVKITSKLLIFNFYNELLEVYGNAMDGFKTYLYTEPPRPNLTPQHTQTKPRFYFRGLLWVCFLENLRPLGDILDEHCGLQEKLQRCCISIAFYVLLKLNTAIENKITIQNK